jgi:hypothetical protein
VFFKGKLRGSMYPLFENRGIIAPSGSPISLKRSIMSTIDSMTTSVVKLPQGVLPMAKKFTVSMPDNLVITLDGLTATWKTTRSGALAKLLQEAEMRRMEEEMIEGYKTMHKNDDIEFYLPAQSEVALRND